MPSVGRGKNYYISMMSGKTEKKQTGIFNKLVYVLLGLVTLIILGIYVMGLISIPDNHFFDSDSRIFNAEWTALKTDGTTEKFTMPADLNVQIGDPVTISTTLPDDIANGEYLCLLTGHRFEAFVDGEHRFLFDVSDAYKWGGSVKAVYVPIPIYPEDAGKTITVNVNGLESDNGNFREVVIGDKRGVTQYVGRRYGTDMHLAIVLAIFSGLTLVVFTIISIMRKDVLPLIHLAIGVFVCSLWVINDSFLFQFLFGKSFIDGIMGYMLTLVITLPFCLYMNRIQERRYDKIYTSVEAGLGINFIVVSILHFSHVISYERLLLYIDAVLLTVIVMLFGLGAYDAIKNKEKAKDYILVDIGMGLLVLFSVMELLVINISVARNLQVGGIFVIIGLYALLIFAIMDQIIRLRNFQLKAQEALVATRAKSDFLANMSHEIRTPINAIMGLNEMILRETKDENIVDYAKDINSASNNLLEIINDILDLSKIESGKMEIVDEKYNFGEVVSYVVSMIEVKANQKKLKFNVSVANDIPTVLLGDSKRITEIFINLLNNAVKYTHEGEVSLVISCRKLETEKVMLDFYVEDTGIGIRPEDKEKLFEEFARLEYGKNKNIEGTGLGLAITNKMISLMGGTILVESEYGVGSKFIVSIPQIIVDATPIGDYNQHKNSSQKEADGRWGTFIAPDCNILVVDDTLINLKVITKLLAKTEIKITTAESGSRMLELIKNNVYDIILLDHMMPEMDGLETLKEAKQMNDNISKEAIVIALTANAIVGAKEMYMEAGFDDYLSKPIKPLDLENMLVKYLPKEKVIMMKEV